MEIDYQVFIPLVGIALSALIGSFAYRYKVKEESKKKYRKLLYVLLEIRYITVLSFFDSNQTTKKYIEHFSNRYQISSEHTSEDMIQLIQNHFENIASVFIENQDKRLELYEVALKELSIVDPLLTYQLAGKESFSKLFNYSTEYEKIFNAFLDKNNQNKDFNNKLSVNINKEKNKVFSEHLKSMDRDIRILAWKCGIFDYFRCLNVLRKAICMDDLYSFEELDTFMDKLLQQLGSVQ